MKNEIENKIKLLEQELELFISYMKELDSNYTYPYSEGIYSKKIEKYKKNLKENDSEVVLSNISNDIDKTLEYMKLMNKDKLKEVKDHRFKVMIRERQIKEERKNLKSEIYVRPKKKHSILKGLFLGFIEASSSKPEDKQREFALEEIKKGNYEPYEMIEEELDDEMPYYSSDDE